jgi:hypothetical protein
MTDAFSEFLRKIGTHNLFILGIVILLTWLLISGFRKGWKKGDKGRDSPEQNGGDEDPMKDP